MTLNHTQRGHPGSGILGNNFMICLCLVSSTTSRTRCCPPCRKRCRSPNGLISASATSTCAAGDTWPSHVDRWAGGEAAMLPPAGRHARHPTDELRRRCALTKARTNSTTRPPSAKSAVSPRSSVSNSPSAFRPTTTRPRCGNSPGRFAPRNWSSRSICATPARQAVSAAPAGRQQPRHRFSRQQQPHAWRAGQAGRIERRCP
jgi:hypothetical protein